MKHSSISQEIRPLSTLIPWDKNPRSIEKKDFERLKNLISKLGIFKPFIITENGTVLGGNMRLKAAQELGITDAPVSVVKAETEQEKLEYALADNDRVGTYDELKLAEFVVQFPSIDMELFHIDLGKSISLTALEEKFGGDGLDENYSQKLGEVVYEPKETNHSIKELFIKETKFDKEIEKIENEELKEMLKSRVAYFSTFDFSKIADYYAYQAKPEEQRIMEKLALVLLDKDQLIEHGFSEIISSLTKKTP